MKKIKNNREVIVLKALDIIDELGTNSLTLNEVARQLKIKPPSLYKHIDNIEELKSDIYSYINNQLVDFITSGIDEECKNPILSYCLLCRDYAHLFPNRYLFMSNFIVKRKSDFPDSMVVLRDYVAMLLKEKNKLSEKEIRFRARALRSITHGFIMFELCGGWTEIVDIEDSFNKSISYIVNLK